jgi:hypothetical protein
VPVERRIRQQRLSPWPYVAIAALSLVAAVVVPGPMLLLGIILGMVGAFIGAFARSEAQRIRGTRLFAAGLAIARRPDRVPGHQRHLT